MSNLSTSIPMGSDEFIESVNRLKDSEDKQEEMFKLATECCKLCNKSINCEDCFVQTIGDLNDPYRDKIEKKTATIAKKLCSERLPSVGIKTKFVFHMMGMMQKKGWNSSQVETEYWKENGWLDGQKPWNV